MDLDNIPPGELFDDVIGKAIKDCDALLVLIGPKWLELMNRGSQEYDWVVDEISAALQHGIPIVPVLLGNTRMPTASDLPEAIRRLTTRQALELDPGVRFSS